MTHPTPKQIKAARNAAGLTQTQAGALVGVSKRTWVAWECDKDKPSHRNMPYAKWELFCVKASEMLPTDFSTYITNLTNLFLERKDSIVFCQKQEQELRDAQWELIREFMKPSTTRSNNSSISL